MTGRVLPLRAGTHRVVDAMLPWYVNGTLDHDERELVERHVTECAQCRREVEWLRELHAACIACAEQERASGALSDLRRGLTQRAPARSQGARVGVWRALPPLWRAAVIAQLAVIAVLGWRLSTGDETAPRYRTLGSTQGTLPSGNIVVVFEAATSENEMRRLLQHAGARIVDGPTRGNAYMLRVPAEQEAMALDVLQASPSVTLAQPLDLTEAR